MAKICSVTSTPSLPPHRRAEDSGEEYKRRGREEVEDRRENVVVEVLDLGAGEPVPRGDAVPFERPVAERLHYEPHDRQRHAHAHTPDAEAPAEGLREAGPPALGIRDVYAEEVLARRGAVRAYERGLDERPHEGQQNAREDSLADSHLQYVDCPGECEYRNDDGHEDERHVVEVPREETRPRLHLAHVDEAGAGGDCGVV